MQVARDRRGGPRPRRRRHNSEDLQEGMSHPADKPMYVYVPVVMDVQFVAGAPAYVEVDSLCGLYELVL